VSELSRGENRNGRRRAEAQRAGRAEQRVDDHRHQYGVQADLHGKARDRGVRHRLGNHHSGRGQTRDDVGPQPLPSITAQPRYSRDELGEAAGAIGYFSGQCFPLSS